MVNHVYPQQGDPNDAENFAAWLGRPELSDYVEDGLSITPDFSNNNFDVSSGKAHIFWNGARQASNQGSSEDRYDLSYYAYIDSVSGISFSDNSGENYVYLNANLDTDDSPSIEVENSSVDTTTDPNRDWLKIAEIDARNKTVLESNRVSDIRDRGIENSDEVIDFTESFISITHENNKTTVNSGSIELVNTSSLNSFSIETNTVDFTDETKTSIAFNSDGSKLFHVNSQNNNIYSRNLSSNYDISSADSTLSSTSYGPSGLLAIGINIKPDDTKKYIADNGNQEIHEYSSGTSPDTSISAQGSNINDIEFADSGNKLFELDKDGTVYQYSLDTAYDISSASYNDNSLSTNSNARAIKFTPNGKMYIAIGDGNINEYSAETPFSITTYTYTGDKKKVTDGVLYDIIWNDSGSKFYVSYTDLNAPEEEIVESYSTPVDYEISIYSGTATITFDPRKQVYSWDIATYQKSPDNETVTVNVEDSGGNSILSNITRNEDISSISENENIKISVDLDRGDVTNNPTLDYVARRFVR
jgi:sugar lactone lactonase YvrE